MVGVAEGLFLGSGETFNTKKNKHTWIFVVFVGGKKQGVGTFSLTLKN